MTHGNRAEIGRIFPDGEDGVIKVEDEQHRYEVFEGDNDSKLPQYKYTLDKAPAKSVDEITGISSGKETTFVEGTDYALTPFTSERVDTFTFLENRSQYTLTTIPDDYSVTIEDEDGNVFSEGTDFDIIEVNGDENVIDWSIGGNQPDDQDSFTATYEVTFQNATIDWDQGGDTPDAGTYFYVTYRAASIMSRYITNAEEELGSVEDQLDRIIEAKFIDSAEGEELDRLGDTFGTLGKRRGQNDTQYRIYLKSVVQSFTSRGTVDGIKTAVSAATGVPKEDITINENFKDNEYEVQILAATPITGSLLEEVAEIADPSGAKLALSRLTIPNEEVEIDDTIIDVTEGIQVGPDTAGVADGFQIDPNKYSAGTDEIAVDDSTTNRENNALVTDDAGSDDTVATTVQFVVWEEEGGQDTKWNNFDWHYEIN